MLTIDTLKGTNSQALDKKHGKKWIYVGRGGYYGGRQLPRHPLANPFTMREYGENAGPVFEKWLNEQIEAGNRHIINALKTIPGDAVLVCHCPVEYEGCHAKAIIRIYNKMYGEGGWYSEEPSPPPPFEDDEIQF